jgi:PAS domain S-box-containing protein
MQTGLRKFSVVAGFFVLVLLLIANAVITQRQLRVQIDREGWVDHTRVVLFEIAETELLLVDAETGQRGYLLTGSSKYLAPYLRAAQQIDSHIDALSQLTADNPTEQANIAQLRNLAHQKLDELAQTVALYQAGNTDQVKQLVDSDKGLLLMDHIRLVAATMQSEETSLEATRSDRYRRSIQITRNSIDLATLVAILGLALLAMYIIREGALRDRHSREIQTREEWFRVTLTSIGDAVIATDRDGLVTFLNPVAEALIGTTAGAATGKDIRTVFPIFNEISGIPAENPVSTVMSRGCVIGLANHTVLKHADGHLIPIEDSASPIRDDSRQLIGVVLVFRDVSEERKSQEMIRKTEKLAAAARLSASVAHEINNPLEAIVNLIYIARNHAGSPPAVVEQLTLAEHEIERVAHITHQALGFYRESNAPGMVQMNTLIDSVLRLYSHKIGSGRIHVVRNLSECPPVHGMAGELRQAISNVIANAIDAASAGGVIAVSSRFIPARTNGTVEVVVADSGMGISEENLKKIFEPFFTTKKDVGTGLGLWVTKEIVDRHGGAIQVRPSDGHEGLGGAAFILEIPCASAALDAEPSAQIP